MHVRTHLNLIGRTTRILRNTHRDTSLSGLTLNVINSGINRHHLTHANEPMRGRTQGRIILSHNARP